MTQLYEVQVEGRTITFEPEEIHGYKKKLLAKRHELLGTLEQIQRSAERPSSEAEETGDLSSVPFHQADIGSEHFQQEMDQRHLERERRYVEDIDNAIEKIETHRFGFCEIDRRPISKERLDAVPWTRYCIECERALESAG